MILYQIENDLGSEEFKKVLEASTLGKRRPIDDPERIEKMLKFANLIITAREDDRIIGVARSLTDFSFCTYLSDLAVDFENQRKGIGKELIRLTKIETPNAKLILLAAPDAITYYPKIGMTQYKFCYFLDNPDNLKNG